MDTFHFHTLLHKFLSNEMTPDELSQFTAAVNTGDFDHLVQAAMLDHFQSQVHTWEPARQEAVLQDILQQVTPAPRVVRWRRLWQAAAAVLLLGAGWGIYHFTVKSGTPAAETAVLADVPAGQQGAVLVLSNGQRVVLDSAGNGTVAAQAGANVVLNNGELAYEKADGSVDVAYNSIITPRGRQFSVTLPDGTKTWLNAGSSLRFPVTFAGKERRVELSGEAYFEVAANEAQPFKVSVNGKTEVLVLGTAFNINGYAEEAQVIATLVSGKVSVRTGRLAATLLPGQQARVTDAIHIKEEADVAKAVAWKNGAFDFNNATMEEVARQLERWYDIEVVYDKMLEQAPFAGKISRRASLQTVLKMMDDTELTVRLEGGRKLVFSPRK